MGLVRKKPCAGGSVRRRGLVQQGARLRETAGMEQQGEGGVHGGDVLQVDVLQWVVEQKAGGAGNAADAAFAIDDKRQTVIPVLAPGLRRHDGEPARGGLREGHAFPVGKTSDQPYPLFIQIDGGDVEHQADVQCDRLFKAQGQPVRAAEGDGQAEHRVVAPVRPFATPCPCALSPFHASAAQAAVHGFRRPPERVQAVGRLAARWPEGDFPFRVRRGEGGLQHGRPHHAAKPPLAPDVDGQEVVAVRQKSGRNPVQAVLLPGGAIGDFSKPADAVAVDKRLVRVVDDS